jgi:HTH-type transcriptional regulator, glycine betaine synthesis regulator
MVYVAGDRRDHFVPETELRTLLSGFLREKVQPHLENGLVQIESLQALGRASGFGASNVDDARTLRKRIEKLRIWHKRGRSVVPIVTKLFG